LQKITKIKVQKMTKKEPRELHDIAYEIAGDWGSKTSIHARPYLQAMMALRHIDEMYGLESAKTVVLYFLANAQSWRGETARRIKQELKDMAGIN